MFRSGSPRPLSKPRNTFALYTTPLTRVVRPLCPMRRLARRLSFNLNINDLRTQWEKQVNEKSTEDIRPRVTQLQNLYKKGNERYKVNHLNELFPFKNEDNENKVFDDYMIIDEKRIFNDNEINLPTRYPKLQDDTCEFYSQFNHNITSIMKKRPYESSENSNEGNSINLIKNKLFFFNFYLGPSPKRTLISRQNLNKTKSPVRISF